MNISEVFGVGSPAIRKVKEAVDCVFPELVIGVELETENVSSNLDFGPVGKLFNVDVKTDASLRGNAFEFITKPMRSDHCLSAVSGFLEYCKFDESNYSDRCSVHVHVNCTDMTASQVNSVALLYTVLEDLLFEFVGHDRDSNIYCIPWSHCRAHLNLMHRFLNSPSNALYHWNKYTALNLLPLQTQGTIEFRQMHGTADMNKLTTWVNLIGAMFKYAKSIELKDLMEEIKELNSTSQYEIFFNKITAGQLPYNEAYSRKMEEGVIFAKYSMMASFKSKERTTKSKSGNISKGLEDLFIEARAVQAVRPLPSWAQGGQRLNIPPQQPARWALDPVLAARVAAINPVRLEIPRIMEEEDVPVVVRDGEIW
jgi:hypothetical protein